MRIYYYCPLHLSYTSGQTIQVIQDYKSLADQGHEVFLFGTYDDENALKEIQQDIGDSSVSLVISKGNARWLRLRFLFSLLSDRRSKVVIGRNYNKTKFLISLKPLLGDCRIVLERHEDAIPYLLKNQHHADRDRQRYQELFQALDGLILTNYSQQEIFDREFFHLPKVAILPNGVDPSAFSQATSGDRYVITYAGQFTPWKNVDLLFDALNHLDKRYTLRIAGGKGDAASREWVEQRVQRFNLQGRVHFQGFVPRGRLIQDTLKGSSALLLPLGDNLESTHFTSPLKLFEYMATQIPVVAVDYPSVRLVSGDDTVYLSANDPMSFAKAIEEATTRPDPVRIQRMNACAAKYSHQYRAATFARFLQSLFCVDSNSR